MSEKLQGAELSVHHGLHFFLGQSLVEDVHIVILTGGQHRLRFGARFGNYSQHINVKVNYIP